MNEPAQDRLYNLLPAIYRSSDARQGRPLQALLRVIEQEMNSLEEDITGLYNNWFIETCDDWMIPYIGDLLGVEGMQHFSGSWNLRSYVANSLTYRRRKGTAAVLENVARDVTGWQAHSVEFFRLTSATQDLSHLRPGCLFSPDLKDSLVTDSLNSPFGKMPRMVDVRKMDGARGSYNISNIGIFLWRLQSFCLEDATARCVLEDCYTFDPTGLDLPLYSSPVENGEKNPSMNESDILGPLRIAPLRSELARLNMDDSSSIEDHGYFSDRPVIAVKIELEKMTGTLENTREVIRLLSQDLEICDLSSWEESQQLKSAEGMNRAKVAIDPRTGRLKITKVMRSWLSQNLLKIENVLVSFSYGFSGNIGAGPYDRTRFIRDAMGRNVSWMAWVSGEKSASMAPGCFLSLREALDEWKKFVESEKEHKQSRRRVGLIAITDSRTYHEDVTVEVPEGCQLLIVAAGSSSSEKPGERTSDGSNKRGQVNARMNRPHLWGNMDVRSLADLQSENPGELVINGLLIEGDIRVLEGNLGSLIVANSTIVPGKGGIRVFSREKMMNDGLKITLYQSICGRIELAESVPWLSIRECIIDARSPEALAIEAKGSTVDVSESTIIGKSIMSALFANDCIFTGLVSATQKQVGSVRFSYLPPGSVSVRRFQCQPQTYILNVLEEMMEKGERLGEDGEISISEADEFIHRVHPAFTSLDYPDPGYAQLSLTCPKEISAGAEDGSEMGAFRSLHQPQRLANLDSALKEYLPIELDAGIFFVT